MDEDKQLRMAADDVTGEMAPEDEGYRAEAEKARKLWKRLQIDWRKEFPAAKLPANPDLVTDLLHLDVGKLYKKIAANDTDRRMYGFIPHMAACSFAQIGALNAESFCERMLSCANLVIDEGNTLLDDDEIEKLITLRMNRDFMEFMRTEYPEAVKALTRQHFGMSPIEEEEE